MKVKAFMALYCIAALVLTACEKESGSTHLKIGLTDAPASYEEVNVDIREVNIRFDGDSSHWMQMPTRSGVYNLLDLQNGVDTLISEAIVPAGKIQEIRLVLGTDNSIMANGELYPLTIPSGSSSGLKIKVDHALQPSLDSITIDFDAGLSVKEEQDGFKLRPVLKLLH